MKYALVLLVVLFASGCTTTSTLSLQTYGDQELIYQRGAPKSVSRGKKAVVALSLKELQVSSDDRISLYLQIYNRTKQRLFFDDNKVRVVYRPDGITQTTRLHVYTYEDLAKAAKSAETWDRIGAAIASAGNSVAASNTWNLQW